MRRFRNLSIKGKLTAGFGLSLALIFVIGAISLVEMWGLNALAVRVTDTWLPEIESLSTIKRAMAEHQLLAMRSSSLPDPVQIAKDSATMRGLEAEVDAAIKRYEAMADSAQESAPLSRFLANWSTYRDSVARSMARLNAADGSGGAATLKTLASLAFDEADDAIDHLLAISTAEGDAAAMDVRSVYGLSFAIILGVLAVAAVMVGAATRWVSRNVSRPILAISDATKRLAAGDNSPLALPGGDRTDEIGVLVGAVGDYRDSLVRVRELAAVEEQERERLRINEAQLSNAMRMARAAHWEYDVLSDRFTFNDNFYLIFHTTAEAVGGYTMSSAEYARRFVDPRDAALVGAEVKAAIEANDPNYTRTIEHRMIYADGKRGYIAVRFFIVKDEQGRTVKTFGVNQDITERKQMELAMEVSRSRLDAALSNMAQGLCMFDVAGNLVVSNKRFAEIYRIPPGTIEPGMTLPELMAAIARAGVTDLEPEAVLTAVRTFVSEQKAGSVTDRLSDGRSVAITHQPMPNGGFVATFEDITERLKAEEKITHLAEHDALTDLWNRTAFYTRMEDALTHLRRSESMAVLSLDLDHFKSVNDMLGHPIGDRLLQAAAERMRSCIRGEDIVARLGGDEFAIVQVPSDQPQDVTALAARLIDVVGAPYAIEGQQIVVGVSVGIAIAPADGKEPDVLMKNADLALYRAKTDGGGVYRFFALEMDARMQARRAIELDLRKAILNNQFELHYQPIVNLKTGKLTSCEALIRWHHPEHGMIAPLDFIPVAEATGLIVPLGEWVLQRACTDAAKWDNGVTVAVNLSPAQFKSKHLVPAVVDALAASGLPPNRLELEITELVLLQESDGAFAILHQLRDLGIRIAMDDFGTGYSSLGYLRSFPFDKIKIDQSFIRDLPNKEESLAIVRAVVGLSSSLGITTTAEGVETAEQLASVTAEGCSEYQGFLFSTPRPIAEVAGLIAGPDTKAAA